MERQPNTEMDSHFKALTAKELEKFTKQIVEFMDNLDRQAGVIGVDAAIHIANPDSLSIRPIKNGWTIRGTFIAF